MHLKNPAFAMLEFLAAEPRMRTASPEAVTLFLRAFYIFEAFGRAHPDAPGEQWPSNAMLPRLCGLPIDSYERARAELMRLGLWDEEAGGGLGLGPLPNSVWRT